MLVNMDFAQRAVVSTDDLTWQSTPAMGVWRKPLEREAAESGHVSSIVKYEAGATFSRHYHPYGEEIFVLDGVFSDEFGNYPKGTYIRNPPGSGHSPFSEPGCIILVKLNQINQQDSERVVINTSEQRWLPGVAGNQLMPLHSHHHEHVALIRWSAGVQAEAHRHYGGEEMFVISGEFADQFGHYKQGTWLRYPHMSEHRPRISQETITWVKTGHLPLIE